MTRRFDRIVPITDLQSRSRALVEQVQKTGEAVVVTQRGRPAAMLVSYEAYEGHLATREEMTFPDWEQRLRRAEREIANGDLVDHADVVHRAAPRTPATPKRRRA